MNGAPVFKQKSQNQNSFQETVREVSRIFVRYIWNCWMILADGRVTPCWLNFQRRESPPSHLYRKKGIISLTGYLYNVYKELRTISRSWLPGHSPSPSPSPSFYLSLSPRPSDQLSEKSNVSTTVTRSPIELSWTAKKQKKSHKKGDRHIAGFLA